MARENCVTHGSEVLQLPNSQKTVDIAVNEDHAMVGKVVAYSKPMAVVRKVWDVADIDKFNCQILFPGKNESPEDAEIELDSYLTFSRVGAGNAGPSNPTGFAKHDDSPNIDLVSFVSFVAPGLCAEGVPALVYGPVSFARNTAAGQVDCILSLPIGESWQQTDLQLIRGYKIFEAQNNALLPFHLDDKPILIRSGLTVAPFREYITSCSATPSTTHKIYRLALVPATIDGALAWAIEQEGDLNPQIECCSVGFCCSDFVNVGTLNDPYIANIQTECGQEICGWSTYLGDDTIGVGWNHNIDSWQVQITYLGDVGYYLKDVSPEDVTNPNGDYTFSSGSNDVKLRHGEIITVENGATNCCSTQIFVSIGGSQWTLNWTRNWLQNGVVSCYWSGSGANNYFSIRFISGTGWYLSRSGAVNETYIGPLNHDDGPNGTYAPLSGDPPSAIVSQGTVNPLCLPLP